MLPRVLDSWFLSRFVYSLYGVLFNSFIFSLIFGLRGSKQSLETDIQTVEVLRWSWYQAMSGGVIGGIIGLALGLMYDLGYYGAINIAFATALILGTMGAILNGLRSEIIEAKSSPNQGIHLSIRNTCFVVGLFVLIVGLVFWLRGDLSFARLGHSLIGGLQYGLIAALWYGGLDVIQHYTLRLILLIQGHTPANYARFLDYAVDRIFLQKVGGGYRFIHRLLLEHFAEMGEAKNL